MGSLPKIENPIGSVVYKILCLRQINITNLYIKLEYPYVTSSPRNFFIILEALTRSNQENRGSD